MNRILWCGNHCQRSRSRSWVFCVVGTESLDQSPTGSSSLLVRFLWVDALPSVPVHGLFEFKRSRMRKQIDKAITTVLPTLLVLKQVEVINVFFNIQNRKLRE